LLSAVIRIDFGATALRTVAVSVPSVLSENIPIIAPYVDRHPIAAVADAHGLVSLGCFASAGNSMLARMAIIAMTTSSSMSVKARRAGAIGELEMRLAAWQ
jgi:hypothetical protein